MCHDICILREGQKIWCNVELKIEIKRRIFKE